jgi:peptidoglycan/xylan/chitin deacetylase (PgdA/CDA1 family)
MSLRSLQGISGQGTIFPFYHLVSCTPPSHVKYLYNVRSEKEFASDLENMLKYFEPVSITDYLDNRSLPNRKRRMVLTFDDGLAECHQVIAPMLKSKGIPAIFFLNNDFIDNRGLFFRYKASVLIDHLKNDACGYVLAAEFLAITEEQVKEAILMIRYNQQPLLEELARIAELDDAAYLKSQRVYMTTEQVRDLLKWGFHVGGHGLDHPEFYRMGDKEIISQVSKSMRDLQERFRVKPALFAFPFTSDGIPERVIDQLLEEGVADVLFGTAGLKRTGRDRFIQRISMESLDRPALQVLKAEYLYYLLKAPLGKNHYFRRQNRQLGRS